MGFFDGNPARLWPHPPKEQSERWAALVGGADSLVDAGRAAHEAGDYRWAATLLDTAVFAEPDNTEAQAVLAAQINGPKAWDLDLSIDITFSDLERDFHVTLRNGVLVAREKASIGDAQPHLTLTRPRLLALFAGDVETPGIVVDGDMGVIGTLASVIDPGDPNFNLVIP